MTTSKNASPLEKAYAWILLLTPVLSQYQMGPLDLDVIVMVAFFAVYVAVYGKVHVTPINRQIMLIIGYIVAITAVNLVIGQKFSPSSAIVMRTVKYCLYLFITFFIGPKLLTYERFMQVYRIIAFAATIYVIIQTVAFYGAGVTLPNKIGGSVRGNDVEVGRMRAFYSEPAAMGYSIVPFVAASLFGKEYRDGKGNGAADGLFVSIGIVLSTSSQSIVALAAIWLIWIVLRLKNGEFRQVRNILPLLGVAVAIVVLYYTGILKFALDRVGNTSEGGAVDARMSGYATLELLSPLQKIFGAGYGNYVVENTFGLSVFYDVVNYSSIAQFLFTLGYIGTACWLLFFLNVFRKGSVCSRVLVIALIILSIPGCPMLGIVCPTWLTLMCIQLPKGQFICNSTELVKETDKTN